MKNLYLFRSNLRILEYYHYINNLKEFKEKCHDFYLLQCLWYLENNYIDEVVIWRLQPKNKVMKDITFTINKKRFIQRFVNNFSEVFNYSKPYITFWRGGFKEYDNVSKQNPIFFGKSLYLGAGIRTFPQWDGKYDTFLIEDDKDGNESFDCRPFYKTCNPNIFYPMNLKKKYDISWICNFTQITYKGQEFFIREISKSDYLKNLKIVHCGNKPEVGKKLCRKYGVRNIEFLGTLKRPKLNNILNESRISINLSNSKDGCPRVSTEILCSGTPLLLRDTCRLLGHYKSGVIRFKDHNIEKSIKSSIFSHKKIRKELLDDLQYLSMEKICEINWKIWEK